LLVTATSLACERGGRLVFRDLNFVASAGEYVELRGPNGSGKSSLLRLLATFDQPASGALTINGDVNYVGHLDAIKPALTVRENLAFWANFFQSGNVDEALKTFTLTPLANDQARLLSQGQRRRLALSRLKLVERPVWLLDEPSVGLDAASLSCLKDLITAHLAQGGSLIAATHADLGLAPSRILALE
jgi:heme exporter protein A